MAYLNPTPKMQFFDANGAPLVSGKLYTYAAGTLTPLATYIDQAQSGTNTNPVILDSRGEADVWLGTTGLYKWILKDSTDATIWTVDNIGYQYLTVNDLYDQGIEIDVASATTTDIGAENSCFLRITGTNTITSLGTNYNGPRYVRFASALQLTYNSSTLILPGAKNLTTSANAVGIFVPKATGGVSDGWYLASYITVIPVTPSQLQSQLYKAYTTAGTSTAFTLTTDGSLSSLTTNEEWDITFNAASGATPTLNRDSLGAKNLKYYDSTGAKQAITATQVPSGWRSKVVYDGTDYVVRSIPPGTSPIVQNMIRLNTGNGYGSTNTVIRRFTNVVTNTGSDITYADSATAGASFTINTSGIYSISYSESFNAGDYFGITRNVASLNTAITAISITSVLAMGSVPSAAVQVGSCTWVGYLNAGDIIYAQTAASTASGIITNAQQFTICRTG